MTGASMLSPESTSFHGAESHIVSLLIFIFTGVAANVLVLSGSQVDTFLILLMVLFLWIIIRSALQALSDAARVSQVANTPPDWVSPGGSESTATAGGGNPEDEGWADAWVTAMDFVSRILVLLTFQVAGALILQEWTLVGVTTQETLVLLFLIGILFFPVFLWIHRTWAAHEERDRQAFQQRILSARSLRASGRRVTVGGRPSAVAAAGLVGRRIRF